MTRARTRALILILAGTLAIAAIILARTGRSASPPSSKERPTLLLLTSLPLMFSEEFSLDAEGSPALHALQTRYRVLPISVTDKPQLAKGRLLLMAQPRAQRPEDLVALDEWVRGGGKVLLLADPMLEWPSKRPLGDPLRPPPMFADTGLLAHWGLRLDSPAERGPRLQRLGGFEVMTASPGALFGSGCPISKDRLIARCLVGKGDATIVADADVIGVDQLDGPIKHNLDGLMAELAALSSQKRSTENHRLIHRVNMRLWGWSRA